jgi:tetratricopeptide (TPR) repeat protein
MKSSNEYTLPQLSEPRLNAEFTRLPSVLGQDDLFRLSQAIRATPNYSLDEMTRLLSAHRAPSNWRFAALYCLLVRARHLRNFNDFRDLVRQNADQFSDQPAMFAMAAEAGSFFAYSTHDLKSVIEQSRHALRRFDGVGLKLLAAEKLLEVVSGESVEEQDKLLAEAQSYLDDALARYPGTPRYLAVKAQVLARRRRFADARGCIADAIAREDSTHSHYVIRLAKYEAVRSEILLFEYSDQLAGRLKDAVRDFEQTRGSLIEIVGLLAAVLALVISGTQIAINVRVANGAGLLMVVGGVLQLSFLGYSMLLGRGVRLGRFLIAAGIALALLSGGVFFVLHY